MRFEIAAVAAFAASAFAAPGQEKRQEKAQFNLQVKAEDAALNNKFLSSQGGRVGIYPAAAAGAKFFSSKYDNAQTLSIHTGDDTHQLALSGANGLLDLVDVVNPSADSIPQGQAMEWSTFVIDAQGNLNVKDGQDIPTRRWVSFANTDGSVGVALYDGVTVPQTRQLGNVTIVSVPAR